MKRVCTLLLVIALCSSLLAPATGAVFDDIADQATQEAATLLQSLGIVAGYEDGTFRPNEKLTRAQFCKMAVVLSGTTDVAAYEGFTIFPDVRANHWGRGYINAAARSLKIIAGFPDGTFKPDAPISFAQAVTTLMRLLGYSDSDVGLNWPRGYIEKANQIGLTKGLNLGADDTITRGLSAQMFYNAIFTDNKDGVRYCDTLGFTEQKVIIMRADGVSPDGLRTGLITIGGGGFYPYRTALAIEEGAQGTLLVDGDGYALNWTPDKQTTREITIREIGPMSVTAPDGSKINNIPTGTVVYINGESNTWAKCWIDIPTGMMLRFFFNSAGSIDYIFLAQPTGEGVLKFISSEPAAGRNPLPSLGIDVNANIIKNGVSASWADLRLNDVIIYNEETNTVNATDFRISGIFENALPNREAPDEVVTLGGRNFKVLPDVRVKLAARKIGDALTFFFTPDGRVADVRSADKPVYQPGVVTGNRSVMLYNGIIVSGNEDFSREFSEGTPVLACMVRAGMLSLQAIPAKGSADLDLTEMKAGTVDITPYTVFYDHCGAGGRAVQVDITSIPDTVSAGSVISVIPDSGGRANLVVLRNVTGDAWLYGFTTAVRGEPEYDNEGYFVGYLPNLLHIDNQYGRQTFEDPRGAGRDSGSSIYGVAIRTNGNVLSSFACVRVNNISRSAFSGNNAMMVSGVLRPIPDGLLVYVQATKEYISIADARLYSNNFSVFLDKPAAEGGKPRFIIAL